MSLNGKFWHPITPANRSGPPSSQRFPGHWPHFPPAPLFAEPNDPKKAREHVISLEKWPPLKCLLAVKRSIPTKKIRMVFLDDRKRPRKGEKGKPKPKGFPLAFGAGGPPSDRGWGLLALGAGDRLCP